MAQNNNLNRRNFLHGIAAGALGSGLALNELTAASAQEKKEPAAAAAGRTADDKLAGPPVKLAVIGLGPRGREILGALAKMGPVPQVAAICDKFSAPVFVKKARAIVPSAQFVDDYKKVLADNTIQAVIIATPTHLHKQIALDAIQAGKHVYCEVPLAHTVEDAKAIAQAAKDEKKVFQSGLQARGNLQALHVGHFLQSSALGQVAQARAQWHNRTSWRVQYPDQTRMDELNWRLNKSVSTGLAGEVGIHQIDTTSWYLKARPTAVSGWGGVVAWKDGRQVPDTIQCVLEYPGGVCLGYDATLGNSFDGAYELFLGTEAAVILRDQRAWMFKEADAGQLGWEVFARKDEMVVGDPAAGSGLKLGTGIALVADATKQLALGKQPGQVGTDVTRTSLYQAVEGFLKSCQKGKRMSVKDATATDPNPPVVAGPAEGYEATVVAIKTNEAVLSGSKITFQPDWFSL